LVDHLGRHCRARRRGSRLAAITAMIAVGTLIGAR